MTDPLDDLKAGLITIGKELAKDASLSAKERENVLKWTEAMALAFVAGDANQVENYRVSLNTMLGVAEVRAAQASEKALLRMGQLGLDLAIKVGIALL